MQTLFGLPVFSHLPCSATRIQVVHSTDHLAMPGMLAYSTLLRLLLRFAFRLQEAESRGEDYERTKYKDMSAMDAERKYKKQMTKDAKADQGFSTYEAASYRQYERLTKQLKPDMKAYKKSEKEWEGDSADANSLAYGTHDAVSSAGMEKMVDDLNKQDEKRKNFSRRRAHHHDADINFINERNRQFNKKLERFYGKYTQGIKDDLERGTAI